MTNTILSTPTVSCMSCAAKIEDALETLEGIQGADVDIELRQVNVSHDSGTIDQSRIVTVLAEIGYEATPVAAESQ